MRQRLLAVLIALGLIAGAGWAYTYDAETFKMVVLL